MIVSAAPSLYCWKQLEAIALLKLLRPEELDDAQYGVVDLLLTKCPRSEPSDDRNLDSVTLTIDEANAVTEVLRLVETDSLLAYADTQFGNRPADYRRWLFVCKDGTRSQVEQYVADNAPGYVLYSEHASDDVHTVMAQIAESAQLPEISAPRRLSDHGIVRSVSPIAGGYRIAIDRVVQGTDGVINNNPQTYEYDVPPAAVSGGPPQIGKLVDLATNGTVVIAVAAEN